jgi:hypothetical protein
MLVQVHKIHLIHLINIPHIVFQNQTYKDQLEAKIKTDKNK